ncbi:MAG: hypothetical protein MjAS7_2190 [Metallosphaera javensis (ex Sakai et al. 2022)]|nr:MAG: hypothetical protein MjAS7_2190 [Metallosphaera javensis (ex Sakai et al. 2022)]
MGIFSDIRIPRNDMYMVFYVRTRAIEPSRESPLLILKE